MIKVITGAPRSGKSYYAIREIILKNFTWNERFHEWQPLSDDPPTIITNIDGLKIPHVSLLELCHEFQVDVARLCTMRIFDEKILPKYPKVVLLIDEAQSYFPLDFKSKETDRQDNTFFFFEYHGHRPVDIYLIGQLWISFSPRIVRLAEYQIEAVRRHLSIAGELRYHFLSGMDIIQRVTLKPDKRIFALYQSTQGELHTTKPPRPYRFYLVAFAVMVCLIVYGIYSLFGNLRYGEKLRASTAGPSRTAASKSGPAPKQADPPAAGVPPGSPGPRISSPPFQPGGVAPAATVPRKYSQIVLGGAWVGEDLVAIDLHGQIVPLSDFPYAFEVQGSGRSRRVVAHVPVGALQSVRPTIWLDGTGVASEPATQTVPTAGQPGQNPRANPVPIPAS